MITIIIIVIYVPVKRKRKKKTIMKMHLPNDTILFVLLGTAAGAVQVLLHYILSRIRVLITDRIVCRRSYTFTRVFV